MVHDVLKVLRNEQNKKGGQKVLLMGSTVQSPIATECEEEKLQ